MSGQIDKCNCCGKILQVIIFVASGFDSATLAGLIPKNIIADDNATKGTIILATAYATFMLTIVKLIMKESCVLCCKYACLPYTMCCCNGKEIKAAKNIRSYFLSFSDCYFDMINALFLLKNYEAGNQEWLVFVGTGLGFGSEILELISEFLGFCPGNLQLWISLVSAIIGIVQCVTVSKDLNSKVAILAIPYYCIIIFMVLYGFCQIGKAKKQERVRKSTGQSIQMGTV